MRGSKSVRVLVMTICVVRRWSVVFWLHKHRRTKGFCLQLSAREVHFTAVVVMAKHSTTATTTSKSVPKKHSATLPVAKKSAATITAKAASESNKRLNSSETAKNYVLQVTTGGAIGSDGLVTNAMAPYGMGRSALERLGWRAGVSSLSTRAKGVLLAVLTPFMDDVVLKAMMVSRADGLRTIQSAHVALAAEAHGVPLQC